jgi:hypothetical protein
VGTAQPERMPRQTTGRFAFLLNINQPGRVFKRKKKKLKEFVLAERFLFQRLNR